MTTEVPTINEFTFSKDDFSSPIVYVYLENKVPLYVGFSRCGLLRPFHPAHNKREARKRANEIRITVFENEQDARRMESELIYRYAPEYNSTADYWPSPPDAGTWVFDLETMYYTTAERLLNGEHDEWVERIAA